MLRLRKRYWASPWACGKFSDCVLSGKFMIGKPLIPFHNMKIKLDALSCTAYCVPVKYLFTVILSLDRIHHTQIISQGLINSYCTTAGLLYQSPYRETQKSSVSHQGIQRSWAGVLKKVDMEHDGVYGLPCPFIPTNQLHSIRRCTV